MKKILKGFLIIAAVVLITAQVRASEGYGPYLYVSVVVENGVTVCKRSVLQRIEKMPALESLVKMPVRFDIKDTKNIVFAGADAVLSNFEVEGSSSAEGFDSVSLKGKGSFVVSRDGEEPLAGEISLTRTKVRAIWNDEGGTGDIVDEYEAAWADIR